MGMAQVVVKFCALLSHDNIALIVQCDLYVTLYNACWSMTSPVTNLCSLF